jgi:hypothetical protein
LNRTNNQGPSDWRFNTPVTDAGVRQSSVIGSAQLMEARLACRLEQMMVSRGRGMTRRLFRGRDDDPLVVWRRLPRDIRTEVAELALRGEPYPYPVVREKALAWATAVCAVPFLVAWARDVLLWMVCGMGSAMVMATLLAHDPWRGVWAGLGGTTGASVQMLFLRARAHRVLRANKAA